MSLFRPAETIPSHVSTNASMMIVTPIIASNAFCAPVRSSAGVRWTQLPIAHCTTYSSSRPTPPTYHSSVRLHDRGNKIYLVRCTIRVMAIHEQIRKHASRYRRASWNNASSEVMSKEDEGDTNRGRIAVNDEAGTPVGYPSPSHIAPRARQRATRARSPQYIARHARSSLNRLSRHRFRPPRLLRVEVDVEGVWEMVVETVTVTGTERRA